MKPHAMSTNISLLISFTQDCNRCHWLDAALLSLGQGALECQEGYQARPKIHVIRVVFQDQALYARASFRGAKMCKIGKKGVFLVI